MEQDGIKIMYFKDLRSNIQLGHVQPKRYVKIIQNSKIALSIFSEQNQYITRRVSEITAIKLYYVLLKLKL